MKLNVNFKLRLDFYVHAVIFLLFFASFIRGIIMFISGEEGSAKVLLLPFYQLFSLFVPSGRTAGIGAAALLFGLVLLLFFKSLL